jgi:hypothetical protein
MNLFERIVCSMQIFLGCGESGRRRRSTKPALDDVTTK